MLTIDVHDKAFRSYLTQLGDKLEDLTPAMQAIGMALESRVSERFQIRMDPNGEAWAPWMPRTKATYPEDGNRRLLDRYGDMLASLNHQADARSVTVGFGSPIAVYHEWGTEHMERRGMLFSDSDAGTLGTDDETMVVDMLSDYLTELG
ncbi:MAG: phage virion morphogenesis protein [Comamonas sp.]